MFFMLSSFAVDSSIGLSSINNGQLDNSEVAIAILNCMYNASLL